MTFQFLCPQGHLLEGEEAQMGQPCDCPTCGMRFIIPTVEGAPGSDQPPGGYDQGGYNQGGYDQSGHSQGGYNQGGYEQGGQAPAPYQEPAYQGNPSYQDPGYQDPSYQDPGYGGGYQAPAGGYDPTQPQAGPIDPFAAQQEPAGSPFEEAGGPDPTAEPQMLHIPCPDGHELETPPEMVGQDVLCPYCGVQFNLRYKDSVEYKAERAAEMERKEQQAGKLWFQWAIIAAVVVLGGLIIMVVYTIVQSKQS